VSEIEYKKQAEDYVFANNMSQSSLFNTFNLYVIAVIGLLIAGLAFIIGEINGSLTGQMLSFVQAAFALGGLAFAIWSTETKRNRVANTYLTQFGLMFEVNALVLGLVLIGTDLMSPSISVAAYLAPWAVYAASFFIVYQVLRVRAGAHEQKVNKTTSFSVLIVVVIIGLFVAKLVTAGTKGLFNGMDADNKGLVVLGLGALIALILGSLSAVNYFKNLLVKKFDIDLSRLYEGV
jgi:hypothetical protein